MTALSILYSFVWGYGAGPGRTAPAEGSSMARLALAVVLAGLVSFVAHAQSPGGSPEDEDWGQKVMDRLRQERLERLDPRCRIYPRECHEAEKEAAEFWMREITRVNRQQLHYGYGPFHY